MPFERRAQPQGAPGPGGSGQPSTQPALRARRRKLLEQVLFNLLDNAHKYAGDAGATIRAPPGGRRDRAHRHRQGPGIKPGELERIFEKFYRGRRADGYKAGTGLGLSISRRLVEALGGTITAQTAARRRGARGVVRLPAARATPIAPRPAA